MRTVAFVGAFAADARAAPNAGAEIIDEDALYRALRERCIADAALGSRVTRTRPKSQPGRWSISAFRIASSSRAENVAT